MPLIYLCVNLDTPSINFVIRCNFPKHISISFSAHINAKPTDSELKRTKQKLSCRHLVGNEGKVGKPLIYV